MPLGLESPSSSLATRSFVLGTGSLFDSHTRAKKLLAPVHTQNTPRFSRRIFLCPGWESFLTGTVQVSHFLGAELLKNMFDLFDSHSQSEQSLCSRKNRCISFRIFGARGENRTHKALRLQNFKSCAYTNFATRAGATQVAFYKATTNEGGHGENRTRAYSFCRGMNYHFSTWPQKFLKSIKS